LGSGLRARTRESAQALCALCRLGARSWRVILQIEPKAGRCLGRTLDALLTYGRGGSYNEQARSRRDPQFIVVDIAGATCDFSNLSTIDPLSYGWFVETDAQLDAQQCARKPRFCRGTVLARVLHMPRAAPGRAWGRPRRLLLGALFDVENPMKVSETPCGATFTTGVAFGWHPACRRHCRPALSRLRVPDRLHGHRPSVRPRLRSRGGNRTRQRGSRGRA